MENSTRTHLSEYGFNISVVGMHNSVICIIVVDSNSKRCLSLINNEFYEFPLLCVKISKSCSYLFVVSTVTPSVYASSPFSASSWPYSYPVVTVSTLESLKIPLTSLQLQGTVHFSRSPERAQNMLTLDHWPETECLMEDMSKKLETNSQQVSVVVCFLPICVPIVSSADCFAAAGWQYQ